MRVGAFGFELALDHHLGGDAGVVGAGDPEGEVAEHAVPAREDVHLGLVEHVAHVEAAGDVGRREQDGELFCLRPASLRSWDVKQAFVDPVVGPALFDDGGIVGFGEFFRDFGAVCSLMDHFKGSIRGRREVGPPDGYWTTYTNRTRFLYA